jgi:hypothetical protein
VIDSNVSNDALTKSLMAIGTDRHLIWQSKIAAAAAV